jgi:hypothetical protein
MNHQKQLRTFAIPFDLRLEHFDSLSGLLACIKLQFPRNYEVHLASWSRGQNVVPVCFAPSQERIVLMLVTVTQGRESEDEISDAAEKI